VSVNMREGAGTALFIMAFHRLAPNARYKANRAIRPAHKVSCTCLAAEVCAVYHVSTRIGEILQQNGFRKLFFSVHIWSRSITVRTKPWY
jgi:hypothetical protein